MQVRTRFLPEKKIIGLKGRFIAGALEDTKGTVIPQLWSDYMPRKDEVPSRVSSDEIGVNIPLTQDRAKFHPDERLYMAGAEVSSLDQIPRGMTAVTIPSGQYAVFVHKGRAQCVPQTLQAIFEDWLPKAGRIAREAPLLEIYGPRFRANSDDSELEIYVPIE